MHDLPIPECQIGLRKCKRKSATPLLAGRHLFRKYRSSQRESDEKFLQKFYAEFSVPLNRKCLASDKTARHDQNFGSVRQLAASIRYLYAKQTCVRLLYWLELCALIGNWCTTRQSRAHVQCRVPNYSLCLKLARQTKARGSCLVPMSQTKIRFIPMRRSNTCMKPFRQCRTRAQPVRQSDPWMDKKGRAWNPWFDKTCAPNKHP